MSRRRSFTKRREPIEVEIGGDVFHAPPIIGSAVLGDVFQLQERLSTIDPDTNTAEQLQLTIVLVGDMFGCLLVSESANRFRERLASRDNPIDIAEEAMPALQWLIEEYTSRPTQPSPPSTSSSASDGTSSTDGALPEELTQNFLTPADSSI